MVQNDCTTSAGLRAALAETKLSRPHRASEPVVRSVEDLYGLPQVLFFKIIGSRYLLQKEIANVTVVNCQFKETCYQPRMLTGRGCMALFGVGCEPSVAESKKWYALSAERDGSREALLMLGAMAAGGSTPILPHLARYVDDSRNVDLDKAESYFRRAVAADNSPPESHLMFVTQEYAKSIAKVDLACVIRAKGGSLDEAAALFDAVLAHAATVPSRAYRYPHEEASGFKAWMIHDGQVEGTPIEAIGLVEAIPESRRNGMCDYLLGKIYKDLDQASRNDEHARNSVKINFASHQTHRGICTQARKAFYHLDRAMAEWYPGAPFDLAELMESGRGTEANLIHAYTGFIMAAARGDERAVARMHELGAAGPPYPPDLVIAVAQIQEEPEATDLVTNGTQTLQEALAAMGLN